RPRVRRRGPPPRRRVPPHVPSPCPLAPCRGARPCRRARPRGGPHRLGRCSVGGSSRSCGRRRLLLGDVAGGVAGWDVVLLVGPVTRCRSRISSPPRPSPPR